MAPTAAVHCATRVPARSALRLALAVATAACLAAALFALTGCASNHPITKTGEACASCHSDGRVAASDPDLSAATETGLTFAIESGADEVLLCTASIAEDGTIVPARLETIRPDRFASVTVSRPGLYALCTGEISNPSTTVLLNATESGPSDITVKL